MNITPELQKALDAAWKQLTQILFCEKTNLIYDYVGSLDEHRFDFLPTVQEVQLGYPNNKGYSTGMEDSVICGGTALDLCIRRAKLFPETAEECRAFAQKLFKGLELCATVHGRNGYIVRSVSPRDGKSCYTCSSRDQMTFWVWGLWHYHKSEFVSENERKRIAELVVMLAERSEKEVVPENDYSILTLDGFPNILNKMDRVQPHEILRLPMFYRTAYALTGNEHWKLLYDAIIGPAIRKAAEPKEYWNHFELSQFLLSLTLCNELDPRPEFIEISRTIAEITKKMLCEKYLPALEQWTGSWCCPARPWRESRRMHVMVTPGGSAVWPDGKLDLRPPQTEEFEKLFDVVRIPGNLAEGVLLAPECGFSPELRERFLKAFLRPDYSETCSYSLLGMLYSALLLLR